MKTQKKGKKILKFDNTGPGKINFSPENQEKFIGKVKGLAEPLLKSEGIELVHIEYQREPGGIVLRIYIDKPGGVTLDDCAYINRQFGNILDETFDSERFYKLEVSSPGANRPISKKNDFEKFKGKLASIKIKNPIEGQKNFKGVLLGTSEENIRILIDKYEITIPYQDIMKAKLIDYF